MTSLAVQQEPKQPYRSSYEAVLQGDHKRFISEADLKASYSEKRFRLFNPYRRYDSHVSLYYRRIRKLREKNHPSAADIIRDVSKKHRVAVEDIKSNRTKVKQLAARYEAMKRVYFECRDVSGNYLSLSQVAHLFGFTGRAVVCRALEVHGISKPYNLRGANHG